MKSAVKITEELVNCATLVAALRHSFEAVFKPFREDFLFSFDGMRRYPLFVEVQSESQRLVTQSVPVA